MQTRKHPRTLVEAFGPYTSTKIQETRRPMDKEDKLVIAASILALAGFLLAVATRWIC